MPIGFLTTAERERLNRFPEQIPHDDLSAFFLLSEADHQAINKQREAYTRLGFALQLCALRYLGFAPDDLATTPWDAVVFVAQQLGVPPDTTHMANTSWLFVVFGGSQSAVRDLADGIARRPYSDPVSRVHFHQKWSISIQSLVYIASSERGSFHSQTMSPKTILLAKSLKHGDDSSVS
jgi:hypothetical protein